MARREEPCSVAGEPAPCPIARPPPPDRFLVIDLGFAIEPREDDCLPEAILGTVRLSRMDVTHAPILAAAPCDMQLGCGATHEDEGDH